MQNKNITQLKNAARPSAVNAVRSVAVVGLGYVGLPLAILAEKKGFRMIGIDIDPKKVAMLKTRRAPYISPKESAEFATSRMEITDAPERLASADAVIVCVPTPVYEDHTPNLEPLKSAAKLIGRNLVSGQLVVVESTVNPGVCDEVVIPMLEKESGKKSGKDFFFAHCPERINPGDSRWNVSSIPRVVGANDRLSLEKAVMFYRSLVGSEIMPMKSVKEAEAVKIVENSFRDINIAFVNELAMSFDKLGIDLLNVLRGASTKPFSFMAHFPGCGVGGHCIPVDPYYLISYAAENGFKHRFLSLAREINNKMPSYTVDILERALNQKNKTLTASKIALLGLSYKKDVPDTRESPALELQKELEKRGAEVASFDPLLPALSSAKSLDDALRGAAGAILATDHTLLRTLGPEIFTKHGVGVVIDGRNCLDKNDFIDAGITYKGIGR